MGYRRPDAVVPSLIETCKLGGIDLSAYLTDAITRIVNDHGWDVPESGRVWMVAGGGAVPALGYLSEGGAARLADIAPTLEALLGIGDEPVVAAGRAMAAVVTDRGARFVARGAGSTMLR